MQETSIKQETPIKQVFFETIDSTQDYCKDNLIEGEQWLAVRANQQLKGRGRGTNTWTSPKCKNIYVTFSFNWSIDKIQLLNFLPQISVLSVFQTVMDYDKSNKQQVKLKWINDLMVNNKKVCGVLCESQQLDQLTVFLGIGVNIDSISEDPHIGCLEKELGILIEQDEFYAKLQKNLYSNVKVLEKQGFQTFHKIIIDNLYKLGEEVTLMNYEQTEVISTGELIGINQFGNILIRGQLGLVETHANGKFKM